MVKTMYVVQADDGMFYCGMRHWDKQLRKAKIYHSWDFADDIVSAYEERNCKIVEVSLVIVQKTNTNADRIRAMSDEELAKWLLDMMSHKVSCFGEGAFPYTPCRNEEHDCVKCGIEWLKQPAE